MIKWCFGFGINRYYIASYTYVEDIIVNIDTYVTGVVTNGEVSGLATGLGGLRLQVRSRLAQVVVVQLLNEGQVGGFGEHRLFLKDGEDTHGLKSDRWD